MELLAKTEVETKFISHETTTNSTGTANTSGNINTTTSGDTTTGTFGATTNAAGHSATSSYDLHVEQQHTKYAVVKYLLDDSSTANSTVQQ
jgi:hypothetical protein